MKIGILGAGKIGGTLGKKWVAAGHSVLFGARDPGSAKMLALLDSIHGSATAVSASVEPAPAEPAPAEPAAASSPAEAAAFGEAILLAVPGAAAGQVVEELGQLLDGKIVIDATNRIGQPEMNSLGFLAARCPQARLYRAFNSIGWENFENPVLDGVQVDLFYCGAPGETQPVVDRLIADVGLRPVYAGGLEQVKAIDSLTGLWFALANGQGYGRRSAFKFLHEKGA